MLGQILGLRGVKCLLRSTVGGVLLLAAGCGRGSGTTSNTDPAQTTAPPLIGATTAALAPTTAPASRQPRGKVDEAVLKRATLVLNDLTPGFAEDPPSADEEKSASGVCGNPTVSSRVPYASLVVVRFSKGTVGPLLQERLASFQDVATAQKYVATVRTDATCQTFRREAEEFKLAPLNVGSLGEETVAYRISGRAAIDVAYVRLGSVVVQVIQAGLVTDSDITLAAVTKATQKAMAIP